MDYVPAVLNSGSPKLDPSPEELRINSPVLLRSNQVVGDLQGGSAIANKPGEGA
jgi:hypothetical protein